MIRPTAFLGLLLLAAPAAAQLGLPSLGGGTLGAPLDGVDRTLDRVGPVLGDGLAPAARLSANVADMARQRLDRLASFVRRNRAAVEADEGGQPAVRGEALLLDPDPAALERARAQGYPLIEQAAIDDLGLSYARLAVPDGQPLAEAIRKLRQILPGRTVTADQIHFMSGEDARADRRAASGARSAAPRGGSVGVIDGGVPEGGRVVAARGFAKGAPVPNSHAQAILSLLAGAGTERVWNADVYGRDPAGGNALAIARAIGWMTGQNVPVVSISLVGPANPLLERAVAAARARGTVLVAAVGNDGAAAPPAYPASYAGVVAVTGVDGRGRALIEAGRAVHLDYAAPGADLSAVLAPNKRVIVRGTSFAAPLAAARLAAYRQRGISGSALLQAVDAEARDLGKTGPDPRYGRGLVCEDCRKGL